MASAAKQAIFGDTKRKQESSFLKKRTKKLLARFARGGPVTGPPRAKRPKVFLLLFF